VRISQHLVSFIFCNLVVINMKEDTQFKVYWAIHAHESHE
jgi:hypothetical protein